MHQRIRANHHIITNRHALQNRTFVGYPDVIANLNGCSRITVKLQVIASILILMVMIQNADLLPDGDIIAYFDALVCHDATILVTIELLADLDDAFGVEHHVVIENDASVAANFSCFESVDTTAIADHGKFRASETAAVESTRYQKANDAGNFVRFAFVKKFHDLSFTSLSSIYFLVVEPLVFHRIDRRFVEPPGRVVVDRHYYSSFDSTLQ